MSTPLGIVTRGVPGWRRFPPNLFAIPWVTLLVCYLAQGTASTLADFRNKTFSPFISLVPITGMLLAVTLSAHAFAAGQVLVIPNDTVVPASAHLAAGSQRG